MTLVKRLAGLALDAFGPLSLLATLLLLVSLAGFWRDYWGQLELLTGQHLLVVALALPIAVAVGVATGVAVQGRPRGTAVVLSVAGILMTVPSIALFGLMIPLLAPLGWGVGVPPAVIALVLYALLPIIRNTLTGLEGIPGSLLDAATGLGLTRGQILWRVKLPLAAPVILAGIRTSVVMGIGVTAIAAYVGAGGLGRWIFGGIRRSYPEMTLAGAVAIALLAILADFGIARLETWCRRTPA